MKNNSLLSTILLALLPALAAAPAVRAQAPHFKIDLVPVDSSKLPPLHSFTAGRGSDGKWLLVGGRTNGLHLFVSSTNGGNDAPPNAFPTTNANQTLWVIDPTNGQSWSAPVTSLPAQISDALSASNAQSSEADGNLYVLGGYGYSTQAGSMITFPTLTAIDLDKTIAAIVAGTSFTTFVQQTSTYYDCIAYGANAYGSCFGAYNSCPSGPQCPCPTGPGFKACLQAGSATCLGKQQEAIVQCSQLVRRHQFDGLPTNSGAYTKVTGGGLERLGLNYVLAFGQDFEGMYSISEGDYGKWPVTQVYSESVFALSIYPNPLTAAVLQQIQQDPNDPMRQYHRRDLNVLPGLDGSGNPIVQALGGVFVPGQDAAYQQPIMISGTAPTLTATLLPYPQRMSQYECAVVPLFDSIWKSSTNLFFGGISLYYVDEKTGKLKVDSGLPFISAISALTRTNNNWSEFYRVEPMTLNQRTVRIGADAKFLRDPAVRASANGVIYLDPLRQKTRIGWMFGGIFADSGNPGGSNTGTSASSQLYEVWLDPFQAQAGYWASTLDAPTVTITPNTDTTKKVP